MEDLYSTHALLQEKFAYHWVLENLLPSGGRLLFHGREGSGKSSLAMAIALCVANEGRFFGQWQAKHRGGVLWIQADLPLIEHHTRLKRWVKHFPWIAHPDYPLFHFVPDWFDIMAYHEDDEEIEELRGTKPCLVIWDVLQAIQHMKDEKHVPGLVYGQMRRLFPDAAHIIIHHDRKQTRDEQEGFLDDREAFSGVKEWINLVVSAWHLRENGPNAFKLVTTKNNCGPIIPGVVLQRDPLTLLPVCRMPQTGEEIAHWRRQHNANPRPLTPGEKQELLKYLSCSFIAPANVVKKIVEGL